MRKLTDDVHLAHLSPRERLTRCGCHWRSDLKACERARFVAWWGCCMTPAMAACAYRVWMAPPLSALTAAAVLLMSGSFSLILVCALVTGRLDTNTGLYFRKSEPMRYWLHVGAIMAGVLFPVIGLALGVGR